MILFALLLLTLASFTAGAVFGYSAARRQRSQRPTPMQRDLSDIISDEIRASRMHGIMDGWSLAKRTDSEP